MAIPNNDRTARNWEKVLTKPDANSKTQMRMRLHTRVHLRPNRSANTPKMTAPRERNKRVRVMEVVICGAVTLNASVRGVMVRGTAK